MPDFKIVDNDGNLAESKFYPHDKRMQNESGGGGGGDMTDRLERLEKKVDSMESTLSRLGESMTRIEGKFDVIGMRFDVVDKRFESSTKTLTDKIDASAKLNESNIRATIAEAKLATILAVPAIIGAVYTAYRLLSKQ